ncbi:disease resistance protein [Striga asiatica]|uniref:Disease resistance protein n=1 Tax=Striga asiatica TaxID=4170 RepID=A0A5A7QGF0_STRAF|nr:disease resistance protein [Striga asiatica]
MATSAFKSTTKRAPPGSSSGGSLRRSRSLSRFSHSIPPEPEIEAEYNRNAPRGKFVNTTRGSTAAPFPEISLDDLALEFFSSSSKNGNDSSDGAVAGQQEREGRSVSRQREIGRWARDTASSSRRRGRSVSRTRAGDVASGGPVSGVKKVISSDASSRRRRSLSVARFQISDSEGEVDRSRIKSNRPAVKAPLNGNSHMSSAQKTTASGNRRLGRSQSHKDLHLLHDGYSSQSSALTDEESKDTHFGKHGFEKIIWPVYSQKAEHPIDDAANGGLYEAMRKELRYAVQEIRTELNQAMGRNQISSNDCLQSDKDACRIREKYATKLEQLEKHKQDLLKEMLFEEQQGQEVPKMVKELPYSRSSAVPEKPSRARKRSSDRNRVSKKLIEEAERYFEDFICNIEDTDISSFDGERSDESLILGGRMREREDVTTVREANQTCKKDQASQPVEMDGVILPWLQWETSHENNSPLRENKTPLTPKSVQRNSEKDSDQSSHSISSHGSWSPRDFISPLIIKRKDARKTVRVENASGFDMDEYLKLRNKDELLFEMYKERSRISSGGMLLCNGGFY